MPSRLRLLYFNTWLTDFAAFLVVFSVTRSLGEAQTGVGRMGLIGGVMAMFIAVASVLSGLVTERFGWRRVVTAGMLLSAAAIVVCALTGAGDPLRYISYCCMGFGLGTIYPPLYTGLSRAAPQNHHVHVVGRTVILFSMSWNVGMISGQLTGGWLFGLGPDWPMYAALPLTALNLLLFALSGGTPGSERATPSADDASSSAEHHDPAARRFVRLAWIANLGSAFCFSMVLHLLPDMMVRIGVPPDQHGLLVGLSRGVTVSMYFVLFSTRFWHLRLVPALTAQVLGAAGMVVIAVADHVALLAVGLMCVGQLSGFNYFASLFYSTRGSSHRGRGLAAGLNEGSLSFGFALGSLLGGYAGYLGGPRAPYVFGAMVLAVLFAFQIAMYLVFFGLRRGGADGGPVE